MCLFKLALLPCYFEGTFQLVVCRISKGVLVDALRETLHFCGGDFGRRERQTPFLARENRSALQDQILRAVKSQLVLLQVLSLRLGRLSLYISGILSHNYYSIIP